RLLGHGPAGHVVLREEADRAGGSVELLAVEREPRAAGDDDVELLVTRAFDVLLHDPAAEALRGVGVRAERADAGPAPDRTPLEPFRDRDPVELVEAQHLVRGAHVATSRWNSGSVRIGAKSSSSRA